MHYLIPIDAKPHSQRSLDLALKVFNLKDQELTLLHIVVAPDPALLLEDTTGTMEETYMQAEYERSEQLMLEISKPLAAAGAKVNISIVPGLTAAAIKSIQIMDNAEVTILSPAPHTTEELLMQGSITQQLLQFDYHGTLVRARDINTTGTDLWAIFLMEHLHDVHTIGKIAPLLRRELKVLVAIPDPQALILPQPGTSAATAVVDATQIEELLKIVAEKFEALKIPYETMMLQTRFRDWLIAFLRSNNVALVTVPREPDAQQTRSAFGSDREEIFLKAPVPTALCNFTSMR